MIDNKIQREFFLSGATHAVSFRRTQLLKLRNALKSNEEAIFDALWKDLHKSREEALLTELSIVYGEINYALRHLNRWTRDKRVRPNLAVLPSRSWIHYEPLGTALIIAPWNYPVNLLLCPLIGAISAGCNAVLKSSPYSKNVDKTLREIITATFPEEYIAYYSGGREVNTELLSLRWDMIFYTGSPKVAHVVAEAAAKYLTPCVLELGGKSPCIIDKTADLKVAARRVAWGKLINAGQTCIAPDYLFVHKSVKASFIHLLSEAILEFYGDDIQNSPYYPHIIRDEAVARLRTLVPSQIDFNVTSTRALKPIILDNVQENDPVMQQEIFGPIFPILDFEDIDEVVSFVNRHEKPLAFYYFGNVRQGKETIAKTSSGGACINDVIMHITNSNLPFGGVGNSGMGRYHRHESFLTFSNRRAVVSSSTYFDIITKFVPFRGLKYLKKFL